tara:strand:- start:2062 stop:2463 length:402 start_codon:yes stop_codon:yes gene_type:complete
MSEQWGMSVDPKMFDKMRTLFLRISSQPRYKRSVDIITLDKTKTVTISYNRCINIRDWFEISDYYGIVVCNILKDVPIDSFAAEYIMHVATIGIEIKPLGTTFVFAPEEQQELLETLANLIIIPDSGLTKKAI